MNDKFFKFSSGAEQINPHREEEREEKRQCADHQQHREREQPQPVF